MAFSVESYVSPDDLVAVTGGTIELFRGEQELSEALNNPGIKVVTKIITNGLYYTVLWDATLPNIIDILPKGYFYTLISGTP